MTSPSRRIALECPKCHGEYEDWYRPPVTVAFGDLAETVLPQSGTSTCPTCGFAIRHGMMIVREEAGVFIVEAAGEDPTPPPSVRDGSPKP